MTEESNKNREPEIIIRRILVALDTSTHSLAALEAAARLAEAMEAELVGLFVEDVNLLRLAALPFAQEICWPSTAGRRLDERKMEHDLRLRASQARRALALAAEKIEVEWSFRVVRGAVTDEVLNASAEVDLISLGRASRSLTARVRLGSTARAAAIEGKRSVLLARHGADLEQPLVITYDGSPSAVRALAAAATLAQPNDTNLIVLIMADDPDHAPGLAEEASEWLERRVVHAEYRYLPPDDGSNLIEALYRERCGLVILGGELQLLQGDMLARILDELECPILLVR